MIPKISPAPNSPFFSFARRLFSVDTHCSGCRIKIRSANNKIVQATYNKFARALFSYIVDVILVKYHICKVVAERPRFNHEFQLGPFEKRVLKP